MNRLKLATVWLDGCSGCHMSLLDIDAAIIDVAGTADLVYGPLGDAQEFPEGVVADPSGAVVAGARVVLTSDAGVRGQTEPGGNGRYAFPLLDPGAYRLEVTLSGFASAKLEGVAVRITES